jgi:uncharacterized protein YndB with AHSA1/START domain
MTAGTGTATSIEQRELIVKRIFSAPRDLVFKAWSDCDHLKHWWGPREWPLTHCKMDFRPGGTWLYCMTGPGGEEAWGKAVYSEIVEPERIVFTDYFSDADGNEAPGMPSSLTTVEFAARDSQTEVISRSQYTTEEDLKKVLDMGVIEGVTETWDRLEEYLGTL